MNLNYDTLVIHIDYDLDDVMELELEEALNEHGSLKIVFRCAGDKAEQIIKKSTPEDVISLWEERNCLFHGVLTYIEQQTYRDEVRLITEWKSLTIKLDRGKKERAVTGESLNFQNIVDKIIATYPGAFCDRQLAEGSVPGFLLQYGETDWEFMKRLSGMEDTVLVPDCSRAYPSFSYGLLQWDSVEIKDAEGVSCTKICYDEYEKRAAIDPFDAFLQDSYHISLRTGEWYTLGQAVRHKDVDGVIERIHVCGKDGLVEKTYEIVPKAGVPKHCGYNTYFSGLHLPATVTEVADSRIRVDFEIEQMKGGEERYFSYAVESSAWYCMPEVGSSVHIYLPDNDETKAYAVHSMRNTASGAKHASATSDPGVKSFTHPSGSAMQLDGGKLLLTADGSGETQATLGSDGTLSLKAKKIVIRAVGNVTIGKGETPSENVNIGCGMDISVMSGLGAYAYLGEQAFFKGGKVYNTALIHEDVDTPAEILSRNDGIEEKIAEVNAVAKQVQEQKVQEAKQKTGMGIFATVVGVVAIAAVCVCTCGAGLAVVGAVAGTTAIYCGTSMAAEGVQDYQKTVESGDYSPSFNFMRDAVLGGNQQLYDILTYGSVLICGIVVGVATGGGGLAALKSTMLRAGTEMGMDAATNLVFDYIDDGSINNGWESYFKSMCMTGATSGLSQGVMNGFKGLEMAGKFSCADLSKIRLGVDMSIDALASYATTGEVNLVKIFLQNYLSNKFTLADPVDGATGSLYIPATDMRLPDIEDDYEISRKYE